MKLTKENKVFDRKRGNTMTAKEYLSQVRNLDIKIQQKNNELEELKQKVYALEAVDTSKEKTKYAPNNILLIDEYITLYQKVENQIKALMLMKHKMIDDIQRLEKAIYIQILYKRYIEYKKCSVIAEEMYYSEPYIKTLLADAHKAFYNKFLK